MSSTTNPSLGKPRSQEVLYVGLEDPRVRGGALDAHIASPVPERLIGAMRVVFFPRFLGTLA